ncbi:hypothetical protein MMPV_000792 [Pyropia vietnamensis]
MEHVVVGGSLIPPINFGIVEENVYRSGMPNELNFPFIEKLQLATIIYLAPEEPSPAFLAFIDDQSIDMVPLGDEAPSAPWKPTSEDVVLTALEVLLAPHRAPLLIMCNLGRHRTGTVVGCLRKLQRWALTSVFEEYRRYAGAKVRLMNEQFIELFDTDLVSVPKTAPEWL